MSCHVFKPGDRLIQTIYIIRSVACSMLSPKPKVGMINVTDVDALLIMVQLPEPDRGVSDCEWSRGLVSHPKWTTLSHTRSRSVYGTRRLSFISLQLIRDLFQILRTLNLQYLSHFRRISHELLGSRVQHTLFGIHCWW